MKKKILYSLISFCICIAITCINGNYILAQYEQNFFDTTIITESNIENVVSYLGLSPSCIIPNNTTENYGSVTVGELRHAIETVTAQNNRTFVYNSNKLDTLSKYAKIMAVSKSKTLSTTFNNDSYTIDLSVTGKYSGSKWTGVGGISVDVDSDQLVITYKIANKKLSATYTASCITVSGTVSVDSYVGVGDLAIIKIGSAQKNTLRANFYASDYL